MENKKKESYKERYVDIINNICNLALHGGKNELAEDFKKLGLYAIASYFLRSMRKIRRTNVVENLHYIIENMAVASLLATSWNEGISCKELTHSQIKLFELKNKRYGNSFHECFKLDGKPYAFGHLQEKINRICSLLALNEKSEEEPLTDSLKDLLGYCVLTLIELGYGVKYD